MEMTNAIKVCQETGGYENCEKCPIYAACKKTYPSTEAFERAMERAATKYLSCNTKE